MARNEEELRASECSEQSASGHAEDDEEWEVKTEEIKFYVFNEFHIFKVYS